MYTYILLARLWPEWLYAGLKVLWLGKKDRMDIVGQTLVFAPCVVIHDKHSFITNYVVYYFRALPHSYSYSSV